MRVLQKQTNAIKKNPNNWCSLEIVVAQFRKKRKKITVPTAAEAID